MPPQSLHAQTCSHPELLSRCPHGHAQMIASYPPRTQRIKSPFCCRGSREQLQETQGGAAHSDQGLQGPSGEAKAEGRHVAWPARAAVWALPWACCGAVCRLSSECGPLPVCCCLNRVFPRPGLPKLSPAVTSCQPVLSTLPLSPPRDSPHRRPEPRRTSQQAA